MVSNTVLTTNELVYSLYYYAIKPKQPLGGDTAACVIQGSLRRPTGSVFRHARTFRDLLIIVKNDTLYENSPMKLHFITR